MKVDVEVKSTIFENYNSQDVEDQVIARAAELIANKFNDRVENKVAEYLNESIKLRLEAAVVQVVNGDWPEYSNYGEKTGRSRTLKSMIADALEQMKKPSGYDSESKMSKMVKDQLYSTINKDFADQIKATKEQFKKSLDEKLFESIKDQFKGLLR